MPQDGINELLVEQARAGRRVVRLKGGDPFVFGRGREEQLFCEEHGVSVDVVPGVTSAVSVPAVAGIPLTHRGVAASFTVVSAHDQIERLPGGSDHTVVLLMGVNTLGHSAHVLAAGARGSECPVAIVEDGFSENQRVTIGTLGTITALAAARQVRSPAVIVVGDVVSLSPHAAGRFADGATIHGAETEHPPLIVSGSADRHGTETASAAPASAAPPKSHWTDALIAGLAADTGLIQAVDSLDGGRRPHLAPSL